MAKTNIIMRTEQQRIDTCVKYMDHLQQKAGQFKDNISTGQLVKENIFHEGRFKG